MTAKRYALTFIIGGALLFASTVAANVVLDPQLVFGTNLFPPTPGWNERASRLRQYKAEAREVDGLMFSSSRGNLFDEKQLAGAMKVRHLLRLSMSYGMITDYLPLLDYIVRDKKARGERLEAVTLLLDPDFFGKPPWTDANIDSFLPPELSGDAPFRYWWRYLTAFQYRSWRNVVRASRQQTPQAPQASEPTPAQPPAFQRRPIGPVHEEYRRAWNSLRPDLKRQLGLLARFAAICRDNNIRLTVALSPLYHANFGLFEPGAVEEASDQLSKVVPLWDFNAPRLVSDREELWLDLSHFDETVASMMVNRMFGAANPPAFAEFGKARGPADTQGISSQPSRNSN